MVAFIILKIHLTFVTCILYNFNYGIHLYSMYIIYIHTIYTNCSLNMFSYVTYILKSLFFTHPNFKKNLAMHFKKSGKHFCKFKVKNKKHQYQFLLHVFTLYKNKRCSMFNNFNLMNHQFNMFNGRQDFEKKILI